MIYEAPDGAPPPPADVAAAARADLCHTVWNDLARVWISWPAGPPAPAPALKEMRGAAGEKEGGDG